MIRFRCKEVLVSQRVFTVESDYQIPLKHGYSPDPNALVLIASLHVDSRSIRYEIRGLLDDGDPGHNKILRHPSHPGKSVLRAV